MRCAEVCGLFLLDRTSRVLIGCAGKLWSHDRSLPVQPISIRKAQSRKQPIYLCAPREFLKKWLPCLIIKQSCYFDYRIDKRVACYCCLIYDSESRRTTCAKEHGLFILITHKSTRSENRITWMSYQLPFRKRSILYLWFSYSSINSSVWTYSIFIIISYIHWAGNKQWHDSKSNNGSDIR